MSFNQGVQNVKLRWSLTRGDYESIQNIGSNFFSLACGNLRHLRTLLLRLIEHGVCKYFLSLNAWFVEKVDFEEKIRYFPL